MNQPIRRIGQINDQMHQVKAVNTPMVSEPFTMPSAPTRINVRNEMPLMKSIVGKAAASSWPRSTFFSVQRIWRANCCTA